MAVRTKVQLKAELASNFNDGGDATAAEFRAYEENIIDSFFANNLSSDQANALITTALRNYLTVSVAASTYRTETQVAQAITNALSSGGYLTRSAGDASYRTAAQVTAAITAILSAYDAGEAAFSDPPTDLTDDEQEAVREAIDAPKTDVADNTFDQVGLSGAELTLTRKGGGSQAVTLPSGGTEVTANPAGTDGDVLQRIDIGGTNYRVPQNGYVFYERPPINPNSVQGKQDVSTNPWTATLKDDFNIPKRLYDGIDLLMDWQGAMQLTPLMNGTLGLNMHLTFKFTSGNITYDIFVPWPVHARNNALTIPLSQFDAILNIRPGTFTDEDGTPVTITDTDLLGPFKIHLKLSVEYDTTRGNGEEAVESISWINPAVILSQLPHAQGDPIDPNPIKPSITQWQRTGGASLDPPAGSIAGDSFNVAWALGQPSHVGAARIVGFQGAFDSANLSTLLTLDAGNYASGSGTATVPAGVSLVADETYTLRLQAFGEDVTAPTNATEPDAYADIIITAHAPASANYHWGRIEATGTTREQVDGIDFSDDDLVTGSALNVADGYDAVPDSTGSWGFYLAAKADQTQPSGWQDANGLPANSAFEDALDRTIDSVAYKVYIMSIARSASDGSITYYPQAPPS
ncbi:MAG: hypothetical protein OXI23_05455 [Gemmatimonadota bacterium]|nr:hypothetical protein [Gemmatimonadota bacterium]